MKARVLWVDLLGQHLGFWTHQIRHILVPTNHIMWMFIKWMFNMFKPILKLLICKWFNYIFLNHIKANQFFIASKINHIELCWTILNQLNHTRPDWIIRSYSSLPDSQPLPPHLPRCVQTEVAKATIRKTMASKKRTNLVELSCGAHVKNVPNCADLRIQATNWGYGSAGTWMFNIFCNQQTQCLFLFRTY